MLSASLRWTAAGAAAVLAAGRRPVRAPRASRSSNRARAGMGFAGAYTAQAADGSRHLPQRGRHRVPEAEPALHRWHPDQTQRELHRRRALPGRGITEQGDVGLLAPPSAYYTQPFSESLAFGVGLHVPFGLETAWANPDNFSGRYISTRAALKGFSLNPTIAFKLEDRLAVGVGLDVRFSSLELDRRAPVVNPFTQRVVDGAAVHLESDTNKGFGFNVGVLAKPSEGLSVGASYRHKVTVDYSGTASFEPISTGSPDLDVRVRASLPPGAVPLSTSIEFPGFASFGFAQTFGDWTFEADVNWYQWKTFDELRLEFETEPRLNETIEEEYTNAFQYRFGLERVLNDAWAVRGGYFFDESPSPPASMSPLLPDANRNGFCLGGSWTSGNVRLDAAGWYVRASERSTEGTSRDRYDGTYKNRALTLGVSLGYSF